MDSHILRKASYRLPALADLAVFRFNTRGASSDHGTSQGSSAAARANATTCRRRSTAVAAGLPKLWLVGWSFGTELALAWGDELAVEGAILLSPRCAAQATRSWTPGPLGQAADGPGAELDDYLRPDEARQRFARVPQAEVVAVDRAKHLWVGEPYVRIVLNEIVRRVNPAQRRCRPSGRTECR